MRGPQFGQKPPWSNARKRLPMGRVGTCVLLSDEMIEWILASIYTTRKQKKFCARVLAARKGKRS